MVPWPVRAGARGTVCSGTGVAVDGDAKAIAAASWADSKASRRGLLPFATSWARTEMDEASSSPNSLFGSDWKTSPPNPDIGRPKMGVVPVGMCSGLN